MRKERSITVKVIEDKKINTNRLAEFFARKYSEKNIEKKENIQTMFIRLDILLIIPQGKLLKILSSMKIL